MTLEDLDALTGARPNGCKCAHCTAVRDAWPEVLRLARERLEQAAMLRPLPPTLCAMHGGYGERGMAPCPQCNAEADERFKQKVAERKGGQ